MLYSDAGRGHPHGPLDGAGSRHRPRAARGAREVGCVQRASLRLRRRDGCGHDGRIATGLRLWRVRVARSPFCAAFAARVFAWHGYL